jgi:hypothetical protein
MSESFGTFNVEIKENGPVSRGYPLPAVDYVGSFTCYGLWVGNLGNGRGILE